MNEDNNILYSVDLIDFVLPLFTKKKFFLIIPIYIIFAITYALLLQGNNDYVARYKVNIDSMNVPSCEIDMIECQNKYYQEKIRDALSEYDVIFEKRKFTILNVSEKFQNINDKLKHLGDSLIKDELQTCTRFLDSLKDPKLQHVDNNIYILNSVNYIKAKNNIDLIKNANIDFMIINSKKISSLYGTQKLIILTSPFIGFLLSVICIYFNVFYNFIALEVNKRLNDKS